MKKKIIQTILLVLTLISIWGVLLRMGLVPPIFRSSTNYIQINETLTSLALSFLAAMIFYVITVVLPGYYDKRKALKDHSSSFESIYTDMSYIISALRMMANISKSEEDVVEKDWESFNHSGALLVDQWYVRRYSIRDGVENNEPIRGWIHAEKDLLYYVKSIKKQIEKISLSPLVRGLSLETIDLLRGINSSMVLSSLEFDIGSRQILKPAIKAMGVDYSGFQNLPHALIEFIKMHKELSKLCKKTLAFRFEQMTEDEITQFNYERSAIIANNPQITNFQQLNEIQEAVYQGIRLF